MRCSNVLSYLKKRLTAWVFFYLAFVHLAYTYPLPPENFIEAKKILLTLYQEAPETLYCGCKFDKNGHIDPASCLYPPPLHLGMDGYRLEWEHIVPASLLGSSLECWKYQHSCPLPEGVVSKKGGSGRKCCRSISQEFNRREANLYNLVPCMSFSNKMRSNFSPGEVDRLQAIRVCSLLIDRKKKVFEPDDRIKGFVARVYLKLHQEYHFELSSKEIALFKRWDIDFPPDAWEERRKSLIDSIYAKTS